MKTVSIIGYNKAGQSHAHATARTGEKALEMLRQKIVSHYAHAELFKAYSMPLRFYHRPAHESELMDSQTAEDLVALADLVLTANIVQIEEV